MRAPRESRALRLAGACACLGLAWSLLACGAPTAAEVGFVLVRPHALAGRPGGLRDEGLDRTRVRRVVCQVLSSEWLPLVSADVELDPEGAPGEQSLTLGGVAAGQGYFARVQGLGEDGTVQECAVTGPFDLQVGQRYFATLVVVEPLAGDPACDARCSQAGDCAPGAFCPSPCARGVQGEECAGALCQPDLLGAACATDEECAVLSCLVESEGYPGGYCAAACSTDLDCPPSGLCKLPQRLCLRACLVDGDCREGYACAQAAGERLACLPR